MKFQGSSLQTMDVCNNAIKLTVKCFLEAAAKWCIQNSDKNLRWSFFQKQLMDFSH